MKEFDSGKNIFSSYSEAQKVAKRMRQDSHEALTVYRVSSGWAIGGVHVKQRNARKRVKSFEELKELFAAVPEPVDEALVKEYYDIIEGESNQGKESVAQGVSQKWLLKGWTIKTGRELFMNNDREYLVLEMRCANSSMHLQMGGAFAPLIPIVSKQAETLIDKPIIWHTWNSPSSPQLWSSSKWFYMIESAE